MAVWVWLVKYVGGTKMTPVFLADCIPGPTCQDKWNRTGLEGNSWVQCWTCWVEVPLSCPCESLSRWLDICLEVWEELWVEDMPLGLSDNTRCQLKLDMYGISRGEDLEWESKPSGRSEPCKMLTLVKRQRCPRENQGSEQHRMSAEGWVIDNQELLENQVSGGLKVSTSLRWQREQFNRGREQNLGCGMGERGQLLQGVQLWVEHHWGCRWRGQNSWGRAFFFFFLRWQPSWSKPLGPCFPTHQMLSSQIDWTTWGQEYLFYSLLHKWCIFVVSHTFVEWILSHLESSEAFESRGLSFFLYFCSLIPHSKIHFFIHSYVLADTHGWTIATTTTI